jgi:hypothetical protein
VHNPSYGYVKAGIAPRNIKMMTTTRMVPNDIHFLVKNKKFSKKMNQALCDIEQNSTLPGKALRCVQFN